MRLAENRRTQIPSKIRSLCSKPTPIWTFWLYYHLGQTGKLSVPVHELILWRHAYFFQISSSRSPNISDKQTNKPTKINSCFFFLMKQQQQLCHLTVAWCTCKVVWFLFFSVCADGTRRKTPKLCCLPSQAPYSQLSFNGHLELVLLFDTR